MPIKDITRMWSRNDHAASSDLDGRNRQRSDRTAYSIVCTDPANDTAWRIASELATQHGFVRGAPHPDDPTMRITGIRVGRLDHIQFIADVNTMVRGFEPGESPLDEPPDIETDFASTTEAMDRDVNGKPMATVNGEPFDPPITDEIHDLVITVGKNVPTWDFLTAWLYMGGGSRASAHNSDTFLGFPPGASRVRGLKARSVHSEDFSYWRATGIFEFRQAAPNSDISRAWWKRIRHEGFKIKLLIGENLFQEIAGSKPVPLKLDGTQELDPKKAHWLEFQTGDKRPFNIFGLS